MVEYQGKRVAVEERKWPLPVTKAQLASILAFLLCAGAVLGYAASQKTETPEKPDLPESEELLLPEEMEPVQEEVVTLDMIRAEAAVTDIPTEDPLYDAACYTAYWNLMKTDEGGCFDLHAPATPADVEIALCTMAGELPDGSYVLVEYADETVPDRVPMQFVSRKQLAEAMYTAAEQMQYPAEVMQSGQTAVTESEELNWATENALYQVMAAEDDSQPEIAVSRGQMASALVGLRALGGKDALAVEICEALPVPTEKSIARENHDAIQSAVDAAAEKYGAEGLQVAVIEGGKVTDTYATGWATRGTDPMTANHKMRIASISKVVVGITAMLLREQGIIDLDQDISAYWDCTVKNPEHPNTPITIRHMLSHTSSIFNAGDDVSRAYDSVRGRFLKSSGFSGAVPGHIGYWSYNNYAFGVLGMTLELAADRLVDDVLEEALYQAMDIDAAYAAGDIESTDLLVTLYRANGEASRTVEAQKNIHNKETPGANGTYFAGGLTISAADLGKLIALLAADGRYEGVQLLSPESVELMETRYEQPVPGGSYQALPLRYWPDLYGRNGIYYHTGSAYGVFNCASYDPETGDGVVVLTSGASGAKDDYGIYRVCAEINEVVYGVLK